MNSTLPTAENPGPNIVIDGICHHPDAVAMLENVVAKEMLSEAITNLRDAAEALQRAGMAWGSEHNILCMAKRLVFFKQRAGEDPSDAINTVGRHEQRELHARQVLEAKSKLLDEAHKKALEAAGPNPAEAVSKAIHEALTFIPEDIKKDCNL